MITRDELKHVASLAKLELTEAELDQFTTQMDQIIEMANTLSQVKTDEKPTSQVCEETNVFREDQVVKSQTRDELFENVPEAADGFIKVPAIIEKDED